MQATGFDGIESVLDDVLATPPKAFVEQRNATAKRLRDEGRRDAADAVKALPRPPASLWALNRLAHEQPKLIEAFLRAADQLREAHGSGGDIRAATAPEREAEARVVTAATEIARDEGLNVTDDVVERVRQALRAAAAGGEVAADLRAGRLIREPEAPSIDALLGSLPPPGSSAPAADAPRKAREQERRELREQISAAKEDASEARSEERAAAKAAAEAEAAWKHAADLAERSARRSAAAAKLVEELQERLAEL